MKNRFSKVYKDYKLKLTTGEKGDTETFLSKLYPTVKRKVKGNIAKLGNLKIQLSLKVKLKKYRQEHDDFIYIEPFFTTEIKPLLSRTNIKQTVSELFKEITSRFEAFIHQGSNWVLVKVRYLKLLILKYNPLLGGAKKNELPEFLRNKRCLLSLQPPKNKCFTFAVAAGILQKKKNAGRLKQYEKLVTTFDMSGITTPVSLEGITQFERQNNVSINCYGINRESLEPIVLQISSERNKRHHVNLLLFSGHYYTIRNFSRFLCGYRCRQRAKGYYCKVCLTKKSSQKDLSTHEKMCFPDGFNTIGELPSSGSGDDLLMFKNFEKMFMSPFVIYMDFETYQAKENVGLKKLKTTFKTEHKPLSVGLKRVCHMNTKFNGPVKCYTGTDCAEKALEMLFEEQATINTILSEYRYPMTDTVKTRQMQREATKCYICSCPFNGKKKCRDHNHLKSPKVNERNPLGNVLGIACNTCNLKYSAILSDPKIPVFLHNGSKYDYKLLIREICRMSDGKNKLQIIPKTSETYTCMSFGSFQFLDTFAHLPTSLSNLVDILKMEGDLTKVFKHTRKLYPDECTFRKLLNKGFFPYEYVTGIDVLSDTTLPELKHFYSSISGSSITKQQYEQAQFMFRCLGCENLKDYLEAYLKLDVTLLADVFENFRALNYKHYGLDVAKYISLPGFAFDAMLFKTKAELELITDAEQYDFLQKGIRGGLSGQFLRYARANHRDHAEYDDREPATYLHMFDCNSLYSYCLCKRLPVGGFRWLQSEEVTQMNIETMPDEGDIGYIMEVDLQYPKTKHWEHSGFPLAPVKKKIKLDELSPYNKQIQNSSGTKKLFTNAEKLVQTLEDKDRYVVHYRVLKLYLRLGMKLKNVHRVLQFKQKAFMKPFIESNVERRRQAKSSFEGNILKLINNSIFGKTMENTLKRRKVKLANSADKLIKLINKPNMQRVELLSPDIAAVELKQESVKLNKPVFVGFTVLELAKKVMYEFLYLFLKKYFSAWYIIETLYTDTDSFMLKFMAKNKSSPPLCDLFQKNSNRFDFSNFPKDHPLHNTENEKKMGYFKMEYGAKEMTEFVGLKAKQYSILCSCDSIHRAKGVPANASKQLLHEDYIKTLRTGLEKHTSFDAIRSFKHKLYTVSTEKTALSAFDDKRFILNCGIKSLPYGHYKIAKDGLQEDCQE